MGAYRHVQAERILHKKQNQELERTAFCACEQILWWDLFHHVIKLHKYCEGHQQEDRSMAKWETQGR